MVKKTNVTKVAASKTTQSNLDAAIAAALAQQMPGLIAGVTQMLSTAQAAPAKPAKSEPAKPAVTGPDLVIEQTAGKHGDALLLRFGGRKWGAMLYRSDIEAIFKHRDEILAATKKLG